MTWQAIIAYLWSLFGPAITELIKKWLDDLLNRAAKSMNAPGTYGAPEKQRYALLGRAIELHDQDGDSLWIWQRLPWSRHARRRRLLERLRESSGQSFLTINDEIEIRSLAKAAA